MPWTGLTGPESLLAATEPQPYCAIPDGPCTFSASGFSKLSLQIVQGTGEQGAGEQGAGEQGAGEQGTGEGSLSVITPPLRDNRVLEPARQGPLKGRPSFSTLTSPAGLALSSPQGVLEKLWGAGRVNGSYLKPPSALQPGPCPLLLGACRNLLSFLDVCGGKRELQVSEAPSHLTLQ